MHDLTDFSIESVTKFGGDPMMEVQYTNKVRKKYEKMIKKDKIIRPIMYISFCLVVISLLIDKFSCISQAYRLFLLISSILFSVVCTLKFYWNWRCPYCGRYLLSKFNPYNWFGVWPKYDAYCYFCHFNSEKLYDSKDNV